MTEKTWWNNHVKPALHRPAAGRVAKKVQDAFQRGRPDVDLCVRGAVALLELKYLDRWPVRGGALTWSGGQEVEQRAWMREWTRAGGQAYFLLGVAGLWYLLPVETPNPVTAVELERLALVQGTRSDFTLLLDYVRSKSP